MIACDTSSLIAYLQGDEGADVEAIDQSLELKQLLLPCVVVTEILSDPKISAPLAELIRSLPTLEISEGYWERAGHARAKVLAKGHKARIADALIAQSCIDHKVTLICRDLDFKVFSKLCGLELLLTET